MTEKFDCERCEKASWRMMGSELESCENCLWQNHANLMKKRWREECQRKSFNSAMMAEELHSFNEKLVNSKEDFILDGLAKFDKDVECSDSDIDYIPPTDVSESDESDYETPSISDGRKRKRKEKAFAPEMKKKIEEKTFEKTVQAIDDLSSKLFSLQDQHEEAIVIIEEFSHLKFSKAMLSTTKHGKKLVQHIKQLKKEDNEELRCCAANLLERLRSIVLTKEPSAKMQKVVSTSEEKNSTSGPSAKMKNASTSKEKTSTSGGDKGKIQKKENSSPSVSETKETTEEKLEKYFQTKNAVVPLGKPGVYRFKCVFEECKSEIQDLKCHLMTVEHKDYPLWDAKKAGLEQSIRISMYKWLSKPGYSGVYRPKVCTVHGVCLNRMDMHAKMFHEGNNKANTDLDPKITFVPRDTGPTLEEYDSSEDNEFPKHFGEEALPDPFKKPLVYARRITSRERRQKSISIDFKFTYTCGIELLKDFARYLITQGKTHATAIQIANRVQYVWETMDPTYSISNNVFKKKEELEDGYFLALFNQILLNSNKAVTKERTHEQATTVGARLLAVGQFFNFLILRDIYVDLSLHQIERTRLKQKELLGRLQPYVLIRQKAVYRWKQKHLLSMDDFIDIGNSKHAVAVGNLLDNPGEVCKSISVTDLRNLLIFLIVMINAARSSNISEMTLEQLNNAVESDEYISNLPGMVVRSDLYKTSHIYGEKLLLLPKDVFRQIQNYVKYFRPTLINDDEKPDNERYLFTSSRIKKGDSGKMTTSNVASACSKVYEKSGIGGELTRCSPTRIRHAAATELAGHDGEKAEVVAKMFMKNRTETTQKFYIVNYNQRESVRLSMKMYEKTRGSNFKPENVPRPKEVTKDEELKWLKRTQAKIKAKFHNDVEDIELLKSITSEPEDIEQVFEAALDESATTATEGPPVKHSDSNIDFNMSSSSKASKAVENGDDHNDNEKDSGVKDCDGSSEKLEVNVGANEDVGSNEDNIGANGSETIKSKPGSIESTCPTDNVSAEVEQLYHNNIELMDIIPGLLKEDGTEVPALPKVPNLEMRRMFEIVNTIDRDTVNEWFVAKDKWTSALLTNKCASMRLDIITGRAIYKTKRTREVETKDDNESDEGAANENDDDNKVDNEDQIITSSMITRAFGLGHIGTGNFSDDSFDAIVDNLTELVGGGKKKMGKTNIVLGAYTPIVLIWLVQSICLVSHLDAMYFLENAITVRRETLDDKSDDECETPIRHEHPKPWDKEANAAIRKVAKQKLQEITKKIDDASNKHDFYKSTKYSRSFVLKILFMARNMIQNRKFESKKWNDVKSYYSHIYEVQVNNQTIKDIVINMIKNYNKDESNRFKKFNKSLNVAREYHRKCESLHNNIVTW
uniref:Tyr recombinase domain-containing protein n=1 Tax=Clytia hemisphaerica TaxID=252671 RepID=A0A7M6DR57_9CNID